MRDDGVYTLEEKIMEDSGPAQSFEKGLLHSEHFLVYQLPIPEGQFEYEIIDGSHRHSLFTKRYALHVAYCALIFC